MNYSHVTFMLSLPRSRSAWMTQFLKPSCAATMHCPLQSCASIDELGQKIDAVHETGPIFIADVAALFFFDKLVVRFPGAKYLIVHRPAHEVEASMKALNVKPPISIRSAEKQLIEIARSIRTRHDVMAGRYFELNSPSLLRAIAKFVTGSDLSPHYVQKAMKNRFEYSIAEQILRTDFQKQRALFGSAKIIH